MSDIDPNKLKVADLREELKARGLDTKGTKPVLVKRLKKALNEEKGANESISSSADDSQDASLLDDSTQEESSLQESPSKKTDEAESDLQTEEEPAAETKPPVAEPEIKQETEPAPVQEKEEPKPEVVQKTEEPQVEEKPTPVEDAEQKAEEGGEEVKEEEQEQKEEEDADMVAVDEAMDDDDSHEKRHGRKRSRSRSHERRSRSRSRERRRSRSRERKRSPTPVKVEMEDEEWESSPSVFLDRYNSDLSLIISETNLQATPLTEGGFAMMWAGVRGSYGVKSGKVAFEVKLLENCDVSHLPADEVHQNVARVGWSTNSTSMQLGEEPKSFGYGGTGKAATECKFEDYGQVFGAGDVITAYVDFEMDDNEVYISFAKNGDDLGICFPIEKSKLEGEALFPHILTKNISFDVNFGSWEESYFPLKEDFVFIEKVPVENREKGTPPPVKKEDCEMIMMVGLPGAGKTYWAEKHKAGNPDKMYNILGTNLIIDKMRVMGLPRKKNYAGRWDVLIDKSTKCLNKLLEVAASKKRNYILDQTNVYASARRRKMQPFEGFQRKAVVIVPTDEEFLKRVEMREKEEGKEVPERAVLEMKANFTLPEEGVLFDSVEFVELGKEEAAELIEKYNKEGKDNLPPPEKRSRWGGQDRRQSGEFRNDRRSDGYDRRGGGGGGGYRRDNQRWGGGGGGGGQRWGGGGGGGRQGGGGNWGWNDRSGGGGNRWGGGGRDRNDRSGGGGNRWGGGGGGGGGKWGGGGGGGGGGRWGGGNDRRQGGGGWNQGGNRDRYGKDGGGGGGRWNDNRSGGRWSNNDSNKSWGSGQSNQGWGSQGSWNSGDQSNWGGQSGWNQGGWGGNWSGQQSAGYGQWNYAQSGQTGSQGSQWGQYTQWPQYNTQQYTQWYGQYNQSGSDTSQQK